MTIEVPAEGYQLEIDRLKAALAKAEDERDEAQGSLEDSDALLRSSEADLAAANERIASLKEGVDDILVGARADAERLFR